MKSMRVQRKKIAIISTAMLGMSVLSFNCAPNMFQSAKYLGNSANSIQPGSFDKPDSPFAVMTANQYYRSTLNVTGQMDFQPTATQQNEYVQRSGLLAGTDSLTSINGPLLLAATSLAGAVCDSLLTKEAAVAQASRVYFPNVDFTKAVAVNGAGAFASSAATLAASFYSRDLSDEEGQILSDFYTEFVSGLPANQASSATQTRNLYLSLCSAMLSSFDSLTY